MRSVDGTVAEPSVWTSSATLLRRVSARPPMAAVSRNMAAKAASSLPRTERLTGRPVGGNTTLPPVVGPPRCAYIPQNGEVVDVVLARAAGAGAGASAARHETHLGRHLERLGRRRVVRTQARAAGLADQRPPRELDLVERLGRHLEPFGAHLGDAQALLAGLLEEAEGQAAVGRGKRAG